MYVCMPCPGCCCTGRVCGMLDWASKSGRLEYAARSGSGGAGRGSEGIQHPGRVPGVFSRTGLGGRRAQAGRLAAAKSQGRTSARQQSVIRTMEAFSKTSAARVLLKVENVKQNKIAWARDDAGSNAMRHNKHCHFCHFCHFCQVNGAKLQRMRAVGSPPSYVSALPARLQDPAQQHLRPAMYDAKCWRVPTTGSL
ncbi:hypothetical protein BT67DRAFT_81668 [Trichocladium antarcticum]|uniref:Uncharacterized protein n=1 Tax=Trichocladium antarcticum TaxID=1450529 RepID=A0AAN6UGX9_9PEZI|nr:hypothetical protein BT67DRAFT_81668 [Trichocladium antarcticum]